MIVTCRKPCSIGGKRFAIGDTVPVSCIDKSRVKHLQELGLITIVDAPDAAPVTVKSEQPIQTTVTPARKRGVKHE